MIRHCIECGAEISACMGFCLARDIVAMLDGAPEMPRELCGLCVMLLDTDRTIEALAGPWGRP